MHWLQSLWNMHIHVNITYCIKLFSMYIYTHMHLCVSMHIILFICVSFFHHIWIPISTPKITTHVAFFFFKLEDSFTRVQKKNDTAGQVRNLGSCLEEEGDEKRKRKGHAVQVKAARSQLHGGDGSVRERVRKPRNQTKRTWALAGVWRKDKREGKTTTLCFSESRLRKKKGKFNRTSCTSGLR